MKELRKKIVKIHQSHYKKKANIMDVLREFDQTSSSESFDKFTQIVTSMCQMAHVPDDPVTELVTCLSKIENKLIYLMEARNHFHWVDEKPKGYKEQNRVDQKMSIAKFEANYRREKGDMKKKAILHEQKMK